MDIPYKINPDGSRTLEVRVKPKSSKKGLEPGPDKTVIVRLTAAPADGQANAQLLEVMSEFLNIPKSKILLERGHSSRIKLLRILP